MQKLAKVLAILFATEAPKVTDPQAQETVTDQSADHDGIGNSRGL